MNVLPALGERAGLGSRMRKHVLLVPHIAIEARMPGEEHESQFF